MGPLASNPILGPVVAAAGLALFIVWPPLAVAVTFVGAFLSFQRQYALNVPATRAGSWLTLLAHGTAVWLATRSPALGAAAAVGFLATPLVGELLVRRYGYHSTWVAFGTPPLHLVLSAIAWRADVSMLAVLPSFVHALRNAITIAGQVRRRRSFNRPSWSVQVGEPVPDFRLPSRDGRSEFHLADERGHFLVLLFIRSDWCPVCHVQIRIFQKEAARLAGHNVQLVAIGPHAAAVGGTAPDLTTQLGVDYRFLVDEGCRVAELFGAVQPNLPSGQEVPLPVTFLVDPEGLLRHASRPDDIGEFVDPGRILSALDTEIGKRESIAPLASS